MEDLCIPLPPHSLYNPDVQINKQINLKNYTQIQYKSTQQTWKFEKIQHHKRQNRDNCANSRRELKGQLSCVSNS